MPMVKGVTAVPVPDARCTHTFVAKRAVKTFHATHESMSMTKPAGLRLNNLQTFVTDCWYSVSRASAIRCCRVLQEPIGGMYFLLLRT